MFKVFYDCQAKREVDGVALLAFSRHSTGPGEHERNERQPCPAAPAPAPILTSLLLQLLLLPLLTAKSNLHVFSKLIVMMAFVDAVFCSLVFVFIAATRRTRDSNRMCE